MQINEIRKMLTNILANEILDWFCLTKVSTLSHVP